jgi:hypothetical protein
MRRSVLDFLILTGLHLSIERWLEVRYLVIKLGTTLRASRTECNNFFRWDCGMPPGQKLPPARESPPVIRELCCGMNLV